MMQLNQGENAGGDKWSTTLAAKPCATKRKKKTSCSILTMSKRISNELSPKPHIYIKQVLKHHIEDIIYA